MSAPQHSTTKNSLRHFCIAAIGVAGLALGGTARGQIKISEIRADQVSTDNDEYFELVGPPNTSLTGLRYIVIGDNQPAQGSGVIEAIVNLDGFSLNSSGRFVAAEATFTLGGADVILPGGNPLNFENTDNVTHMLVTGFTGAANQDLDTNNDGVLDVTPWLDVLDSVALLISARIPPVNTEWTYSDNKVGPDGAFAASHAYRGEDCGDWQMGKFELIGDTPGAANPDCPPPPVEYFFGLAHQRLGGAILIHGDVSNPDALVISNIGSSGNDGVSIDLGPVEGFVTSFEIGQAMPLDAFMVTHLSGMSGGVPDQPAGSIGMLRTSEGILPIVDFTDLGSPTYKVTIMDGDTVVFSGGGFTNGDGPIMQLPFPGPYPVTCTCKHTQNNNCSWSWKINLLNLVFPVGGGTVKGDQIIFENESHISAVTLDHVDITGGGMPEMVMQGEGLLAHELTHTVQQSDGTPNNAHIIGGGDLDEDGRPDIIVANIGSTGQDGVELKLPPNKIQFGASATMKLVSVEADFGQAGALPQNARIDALIAVSEDSVNTLYYTLSVLEIGSGVAAVQFSPCNEPGCCDPCCPCAGIAVQALRSGVVVDQVVYDILPAAIASGNIGSSGQDGVTFSAALIDSCANLVDDRYLLGLRMASPNSITLSDTQIGAVLADELRLYVPVVPAGSGGPVGPPLAMTLKASNVDFINILDGDFDPAVNPALEQIAYGLTHAPEGGASLTVNPDGSITARDFHDTDSDDDGISIDLREAEGWVGEADFGTAGALLAGTRYVLRAGIPLKFDTTLGFESPQGGQAELSFGQNICPTCGLHVDLLHEGLVVASADVLPPYPPFLVSGDFGTAGTTPVRIRVGSDIAGGPQFNIVNGSTTPMTLSDGSGADANAVRIHLNGLPPGEPVLRYGEIKALMGGTTSFTMSNEKLIHHGAQHTALGQATMCAGKFLDDSGSGTTADALRIANIGSSGQDGVSICCADLDGDGWADPIGGLSVKPRRHSPRRDVYVWKIKGILGGSSGAGDTPGDINDITVEAAGGGRLISIGQPPMLSNPVVTLIVKNAGQVVATVDNDAPGGLAFAVTPDLPGQYMFDLLVTDDIGLASFRHTLIWDTPVDITPGAQQSVTGDELIIEVTGELPQGTKDPGDPNAEIIGEVTSAELLLTADDGGDDDITILEESFSPAPTVPACPADLVQTGIVDVDDLLAVINTWGNCNPGALCPADIAPPGGSGVVDVDDLLAVINAWGPCN